MYAGKVEYYIYHFAHFTFFNNITIMHLRFAVLYIPLNLSVLYVSGQNWMHL